MNLRVLLWLALRRVAHFRGRMAILVACLAVTLFLPWAAARLLADYRVSLTARAAATPLIFGAHGNRFDLAFTALYFRRSGIAPVPFPELAGLQALDYGLAVPLHVGFTAQGHPLVGTSPEYFERRGLSARQGSLPLGLGEVVLGARAAGKLGLEVGDALFSDQRELYDISVPPALKMRVSGVLAANRSTDDDAVFVDVGSCWILEGLSHGHQEAQEIDPALVLGSDDRGHNIVLSRAMIEYNEVTADNAASYHYHGDPNLLPLTAVLFWPKDDKSGTLIQAQINQAGNYAMLAPKTVVDDLLAYAFRIKRVFDGVAATLALSTLALTLLVLALAEKLRATEMRALERIGASRGLAWRLRLSEFSAVLFAATLLAAAGVALARQLLPRLLHMSA